MLVPALYLQQSRATSPKSLLFVRNAIFFAFGRNKQNTRMSINKQEKTSIKTFCNLHRQIREIEQPFAQQKSEMNRQKKALKEELYKTMKENDWGAVKIGNIDGKDMFARLQVYKSQKPINIDVVRCALDNLDTSVDDVVTSLLTAIQDSRTSSREFVQITKSKPKNMMIQESYVVQQMGNQLQHFDANLKNANAEMKESTKSLKEELSSHENIVKAYMTRSQLTSQRININEKNGCQQSYFIRKKISERKAKVTKAIIQSIIEKVLEEASIVCFDGIQDAKDDVAARIIEKIEQLPKERTEKVTLDRGALKRPVDDEESSA